MTARSECESVTCLVWVGVCIGILGMLTMKPVSFIFILVLAVFAAGCSGSKYYQKGVEPSNMSTIQLGSSRQVIEELLGEPVESKPDGDGQVDTYEYNMGRAADMSKAGPLYTSSGGGLIGLILFVGIETVHQGYQSASAKADFKKQKGRVKITYATDDTAITVEVMQPKSDDRRFQAGVTTRASVLDVMGAEPSLALRAGNVFLYRETPETFLVIEFEGDVVQAVATTTACTYSGICVALAENKKHPPLVFSPPRKDAIAKDFSAKPALGCAIYAYSDIRTSDKLVDLQEMTLDQQPAGILHRRGYLWWLVSQGIHTLEVLGDTLDSKKRSPKMEIDCHSGETFFIRTRSTTWSLLSSAPGLSKRVPKYLEQVGERKGQKEIGKRRLLMDNFAFPAEIVDRPIGP